MKPKIRIILADDHEVIIDGIISMLNTEPDIQVVGKALNANKLLDILKTKDVDVVVMDVEMPGMDGLEATKIIKQKYPDIKVLILTQHNKRRFISHAIQNGADGYIIKDSNRKTLIEGIKAVSNGQLFTTGIQLNNTGGNQKAPELSDREKEIICLIVKEKTSIEIASELNLSTNTINQHRKNIMHKLDVKSVVGIVNYAHHNNLCD